MNQSALFDHVRTSVQDLQSTISVKDMFLNNKDLLAISIVQHTVVQPWRKNESVDAYINQAAWSLAMIDKLTLDHCGDCTKLAAPCETCVFEIGYLEAMEILADYDKVIVGFDKYNKVILMMTVMALAEKYWTKYKDDLKQDNDQKLTEFDENSLFEEFLNLTEQEQDLNYARMKALRDYLDNPVKIEGIPWW